MSIAAVPPPPTTKGWLAAPPSHPRRMLSSASPKAAISAGAVCPGGGEENAASTPGETSTGPGIISSERSAINPPRDQSPWEVRARAGARSGSCRDQTIDQPQGAVDAQARRRQGPGVGAEAGREQR